MPSPDPAAPTPPLPTEEETDRLFRAVEPARSGAPGLRQAWREGLDRPSRVTTRTAPRTAASGIRSALTSGARSGRGPTSRSTGARSTGAAGVALGLGLMGLAIAWLPGLAGTGAAPAPSPTAPATIPIPAPTSGVWVVTGPSPVPADLRFVRLADLPTGACGYWDPTTPGTMVSPVPCSGPHDFRVVGTVDPDNMPQDSVNTTCASAYRSQADAAEASGGIRAALPSLDDVRSGRTMAICVVRV